MANTEFIQEIEDSKVWRNLDWFCFSDGKTIHSFPWINTPFDSPSEHSFENISDGIFYIVIRSYGRLIDLEHLLRNLFIKIAEIECVEISNEGIQVNKKKNPRIYATEFRIYRPSFWEDSLSKLIYYMLALSSLMDFPILRGEFNSESLGALLFEIFRVAKPLDTEKFFHKGIAELFNSIAKREKDSSKAPSVLSDGSRLIADDMDSIVLVLQSSEDLKNVLDRVDRFDSEKITDEILIQYDTMRRHF